MASTWKCQRITKGVKCGYNNPGRIRICLKCGKPRPKKKVLAHRQILQELSYEDYIKLNGGEFCWIHKAMGLPDPPRRGRLCRDHDHKTGKARGLLCNRCNRDLKDRLSKAWLIAAVKYLEEFT